MNLEVLKRSRKKPQPGDIFVARLPGRPFVFGRVIRTDATVGGFHDTILVYFYRASSDDKSSIPELSRDDLLIAPLATNARPWTMGYFETVGHSALVQSDVRPVHSFRDALRGWFFDDNGCRQETATEPIGTYGLHSFQTIDDALSDALGVPRFE